MGGGSWSDDAYKSLSSTRSSTVGVSSFTHDHSIRTGAVKAGVHDRLNPKGVVNRESRDSVAHPTSNAIAVLFDVTGSMGGIPRVLQTKLPKLMSILAAKGAIEHPQILFGAIGDYHGDEVPLQVGQFESDVAMDEDLDKIYIEGGGGGQKSESYELGLYFMARHTSIDCLEKRGKKGYLFMIGDEMARNVEKRAVNDVIGDNLETDIQLSKIAQEAQEKYEVYFIIPTRASHGQDKDIQQFWEKLFGQNVLKLDDESLVCELIATTIALAEDSIDSVSDVAADLGLSKSGLTSLTNALSVVQSNKARGLKKATMTGDLSMVGTNGVEIL